MTDIELKRSLIAKINQIQDPTFLKALLVITEGQAVAPTKRYSWGEPAARNWLERKQPQEHWDNSPADNFFEDMEQLLRDNN
jgi:hypothetical protein